ncbi:MAG: phosphomannomutase/phosphoglucomutase, partial [Clostridiales bacterium]|nr:phosphomannomutase/phosphoglucomutase [Clostridiales bacterium]
AKCAKAGKNLTDLIADLPEPKEAAEVRLHFTENCDFKALGASLIHELEQYVEDKPYITPAPDNHEGIRINFDRDHGDGWALVRLSLHEPILPVNVESNKEGGNALILSELYSFFTGYNFLDLQPFKKFL